MEAVARSAARTTSEQPELYLNKEPNDESPKIFPGILMISIPLSPALNALPPTFP